MFLGTPVWRRTIVCINRLLHFVAGSHFSPRQGLGSRNRRWPGFQGTDIDRDLSGGNFASSGEVVAGLRVVRTGDDHVAGSRSSHRKDFS